VVAAARKQSEVAFGNVLGSNVYNLLGIGGATALIAPTTVPAEMVQFDNWAERVNEYETAGVGV